MNKSFKEYITESAKKWEFKIKVAGECTKESEEKMKTLLEKFKVSSFKKIGVTPIQELPLDFPKIKNTEVTVFEATVDYPTTQNELHEYLCVNMGVTKDAMVVRRPGEPLDEYQNAAAPREGALLDDPDYKEAGDPKFDDYYGDKYNESFLKELNDVLKLQRKARGEEIPTESAAKFVTDDKENSKSPIVQSADPRKKGNK